MPFIHKLAHATIKAFLSHIEWMNYQDYKFPPYIPKCFKQNINTRECSQILMAGKYYVDTAIWRDIHENRKDKNKQLGELAFESFKKIRTNKEKIIYSDFVVEELSHAYDKQTINKLFKDV